ncbi:MAG: hypothetical protein ACOCVA_09205 [Prolixibacteraceae bacterium]
METLTSCSTNVATILTCRKIAKSFKENIYELSSIRKEWDPEFATSLNVWIQDTIEKYYAENINGIEDEKHLDWHEAMVAALQNLKILRASMKVDFKNDKPFLKQFFKQHGYSDYFSDAKNGDHLSLCKFLLTFKENLNDDTRKKIVARGTVDSVFDKILSAANQLSNYQECFELLEGEYQLNSYGQKEVIEIYNTIKDICRITTAYYQFEPMQRDKFNFYKVMVNL